MMPGKPPPAPGCATLSDLIEDLAMMIKTWMARFRFPYEVGISQPRYGWNEWYDERYVWIMENIRDPERNLWLDLEIMSIRDDPNLVPASWVIGKLRFRHKEDALHYKMRWL